MDGGSAASGNTSSGGSTTVIVTYKLRDQDKVTTVTTTYSNGANVYLQKANTWCLNFEQEAVENNTETLGETSTFTYTEEELKAAYDAGETLTCSSKSDSKTFNWTINTKTEREINYEKFLGQWKNADGKYSLDAKFDIDGKEVGYYLPDGESIKYPAIDIAENGRQRIDTLLRLLELHENTQFHEQLMRYYWNKYLGEDLYDVDIEGLINLFSTDLKTLSSSFAGGMKKKYIRTCEGSGPMSADGTKYIIYADATGHPTVGYGVLVSNIASDLIAQGYSTEVGAEIDVDVVDAYEDAERESCLSSIKAATAGLNLKEYQIHALVSRAYNCGVRFFK